MLALIKSFFLESIAVLVLMLVAPALMVWASRRKVRPKHALINAVLALLTGVTGISTLAAISESSGAFGVVLATFGLGALALSAAFLSAAVSVLVVQLLPTRSTSPKPEARFAHRPLTEQYKDWQQETNQPRASYEDFLHEAHPRKFPASALAIIGAAIAMALVFALILRR